ncbi:MAG: 4Fe-4S binding protein, partial [Planctomycetota bacterium]|nr:4Fe-4S binding protein [Planctomycetota bacterium]
MKLAIASGKGGTGKTTVATNLAYAASQARRTVAYLDCDVEEPNGHLFLKPEIDEQHPIEKLTPEIDPTRCTHCGQCARACRYGAIASLPEQTLVFAELCHACGGCLLACPADAIREVPRSIGLVRAGRSGGIRFVEGVLNVGEAMAAPAIRAVKAAAPATELTILDAPPGTSCPVIESVRGSDLVLLVTEPT